MNTVKDAYNNKKSAPQKAPTEQNVHNTKRQGKIMMLAAIKLHQKIRKNRGCKEPVVTA